MILGDPSFDHLQSEFVLPGDPRSDPNIDLLQFEYVLPGDPNIYPYQFEFVFPRDPRSDPCPFCVFVLNGDP